ncbi:MAG: thiolase family protein, partial [Deltaproteobacteria bacterium]|nr:thiolase family protein [Deltaproteobacteria bacterium]
MQRVAIVGYAQSRHQVDAPTAREDMVFPVVREAMETAGIDRRDLGAVISGSSDFLDGRTISNVFLSMANGAYLKDESKVEEDGTFALVYAMMKILSGAYDVALVSCHTQASTFNPHQVSFYTLDPLLDRQVGVLNDVAAAGIQAGMYMRAHGVSEEEIALVALKNLQNAGANPHAARRMPEVTMDEVLSSRMYYDPVRELTMSCHADGAAVVILASEDRAYEFTDEPVWIEGVGTCQEAYLRDRDLLRLSGLSRAAEKAYAMAGIEDPASEIQVFEVSEKFAHEELLICEALGLCRPGRAAKLLEKGYT